MIANETAIHQSSKEVDVSNYSKPYGLQKWEIKPYRIVGYKGPDIKKNDENNWNERNNGLFMKKKNHYDTQ